MSVVSVQARDFILALFIRDDGERFLLGDNGYDFKDGQLHFVANSIENDEVAKQGTDGVMLAGQVRRASVQEFEGYVGDATDAKDEIEEKRKAFIAFFAKGHHFRVVYVDCNSNAWQRKGGYLVDAPEVKELWQIHPEYHVGLNFEDVNYYSYNEDAEGDEILANYLNVPVSSDVSGGLEWDENGAVSEDATTEVIGTTASSAEGTAINLAGSAEAPIVKLDVNGNTVQNGTPTPSAPVAVQTVTGENVIKICGKNLLNIANGTYSDKGVTAVVLDGKITINGTATGGTSFIFIPFKFTASANDTYTLSANNTSSIGTSSNYAEIRLGYNPYILEAKFDTINSSATYTFAGAFQTSDFLIRTANGLSYTDFVIYPQLELGSSASTYEAYKSQSYEVNLGKNLLTFGNSDISGTLNGITYSYNAATQEWTFDGTASARADVPYPSGADINMHLRSGIKYTTTGFYQSGTISGGSIKLFQQDSHHNWQGITVTMSSAATSSESYTPSAELVLDDSHIFRIASGTVLSNYKVKFQTEIAPGTSYAPYFTPLELCKIGDYQDYIWNDNGTWKVHKVIGKNVFTGSEQWFRSGRTTATVFMASTEVLSLTIKNDERQQSISSHFKFSGSTGIGNFDLYNGTASAQYLVFGLDATSVPDVTAAKAWVTANQPTIYYILTNPTDETITNATLIAQLDALAASYSYNGQTNITDIVATGNSQALLKADYYTSYRVAVTGGGLVWEEGGSGGPTTVINNSIDNVDPVWTVYGPTINPVLENTTTGEEIEYVGTIADGQTLVIDMGEQTALLNGLNVIGNVTGDYISLAPGQNTLLYTTSSGDGDSAIGWSEIVG